MKVQTAVYGLIHRNQKQEILFQLNYNQDEPIRIHL